MHTNIHTTHSHLMAFHRHHSTYWNIFRRLEETGELKRNQHGHGEMQFHLVNIHSVKFRNVYCVTTLHIFAFVRNITN